MGIFGFIKLKFSHVTKKAKMVNGFLKFNADYKLVPDENRKDIDERLMTNGNSFKLINDEEWWFDHDNETFNSSSIIRMLALCANDNNYHEHVTIAVEYNAEIGHDVIRYTWYDEGEFCDYFLFPIQGKIRLLARLRNHYQPEIINFISVDLDMNTTVEDLYIMMYENLDRYKACPALMGCPVKLEENAP